MHDNDNNDNNITHSTNILGKGMNPIILPVKPVKHRLKIDLMSYPARAGGVGKGGSRGVMVIVAGYEHGDTSSNPGQDSLHFT